MADLARQLESTGRELESCTRESSDRIHRLQVESEERYSSLTKHFETRIEELSQSERNAVGRAQRAERRCNALEEQVRLFFCCCCCVQCYVLLSVDVMLSGFTFNCGRKGTRIEENLFVLPLRYSIIFP